MPLWLHGCGSSLASTLSRWTQSCSRPSDRAIESPRLMLPPGRAAAYRHPQADGPYSLGAVRPASGKWLAEERCTCCVGHVRDRCSQQCCPQESDAHVEPLELTELPVTRRNVPLRLVAIATQPAYLQGQNEQMCNECYFTSRGRSCGRWRVRIWSQMSARRNCRNYMLAMFLQRNTVCFMHYVPNLR